MPPIAYTNRISAHPKNFCLSLLAIIMLYASIISFTGQIFSYIDIIILSHTPNISYEAPTEFIRWNTAVLAIAFPAYLILFTIIQRECRQFPEKKELSIRKWANYLAVFVASIVILCDAISLVYCFLNGDLNSQFLLKVLVLFLIFTWLLYFFIRELRFGWRTWQLRIIGLFLSFIAIVSIGYGFTIVGSPFNARLLRMDQNRIYALEDLESRIILYWKDNKKLPVSLDALTNSATGFKAPRDPQTGNAYEYHVLTKVSFELCATFNLAANNKLAMVDFASSNPQTPWNWQHGKGRYCFHRAVTDRTI